MTQLTIFTAPKPFTNPHIATIQRNAIRSWLALGPQVEVQLIGEEAGLAETAAELGIRCLPGVERNAQGTPLVSSIFDLARRESSSPLLAYVNADILLLPDFLQAACRVAELSRGFLIVGQRWDLDVREPIDFIPGWQLALAEKLNQAGRLHPPGGSDYFIFPRAAFAGMPAFAVGRAGWDNWMIYHARCQGWAVVDATASVRIIHQDHDYSHLPGGQPHYRLPETGVNVRLAGGRRTIFGLGDANRRLAQGQLARKPLSWGRFWREVEIFPLVRLRSLPLGQLSFAVLHPVRAYREFRTWLREKNTVH